MHAASEIHESSREHWPVVFTVVLTTGWRTLRREIEALFKATPETALDHFSDVDKGRS